MHQGLAAVLATGQMRSRYLVLLAEAVGHVGQVEEGLRLQGELLLRQLAPDAAQAKVCFQQALALASRQQAKAWELRTAMSLARLWQRQGKRAEAKALLAELG